MALVVEIRFENFISSQAAESFAASDMLLVATWVEAVSSGLKAWVVVPSGYVTD